MVGISVPEAAAAAGGGGGTPLTYFDEQSPEGILAALHSLGTYVEIEGPFDGVITFSIAASLVATWLVDRAVSIANAKLAREGRENDHVKQTESEIGMPFKCTVFVSASLLANYEELRNGRLLTKMEAQQQEALDEDNGNHQQQQKKPLQRHHCGQAVLSIPTVHIWGSQDYVASEARAFAEFCDKETRSVLVHQGGHQVLSTGVDLINAVNAMRRCIFQAQGF